MDTLNNSGIAPQNNAVPQMPAVQEPVQPVVPQMPAQPAPAPAVAPEAREKTKEQFEKLLESNRRLFEANELLKREMDQRRQSTQTFAPIQNAPVAPRAPSEQVNPADFVDVDPISGESFINEGRLKARMEEIQQRASRAENAVNSYIQDANRRELEKQEQEAYQSYPELNPGSATATNTQFNPSFNKQVRGVLFDSMMNVEEYGGRPLSFKEAADFVKAQYPQTQPTAQAGTTPEANAQAAQSARELKEQSTAHTVSQPQNAPQPVYDEEVKRLRVETRYGSDEALARRLMHTEHIVSDKAQ